MNTQKAAQLPFMLNLTGQKRHWTMLVGTAMLVGTNLSQFPTVAETKEDNGVAQVNNAEDKEEDCIADADNGASTVSIL